MYPHFQQSGIGPDFGVVVCLFVVVCFVSVVLCCVLCIVHPNVLVGLCRNAICLGLSFFVGFLVLLFLPERIVMFRSGRGLLIAGPFGFVGFSCLE